MTDLLTIPVLEATREQAQEMITLWRAQRAKRLEENRIMEDSKKKEQAMYSWLLEVFKQQKYEGMMIGGRVTGLADKEIPYVEDKEAFLKYMKETGELDLLEFRMAKGAVEERFANGVEVPGVAHMTVYDLFDRKV